MYKRHTPVFMLLCPRAHVFMKHLCRSVGVMWRMTIHPHASQTLAGWRLIINANYNQRSRSELERIIAPLWLCVRVHVCVRERVCVSCITVGGWVTKCQVLTSQADITGQVRCYNIDLFVRQILLFQSEGQVKLIKVCDVTVCHKAKQRMKELYYEPMPQSVRFKYKCVWEYVVAYRGAVHLPQWHFRIFQFISFHRILIR